MLSVYTKETETLQYKVLLLKTYFMELAISLKDTPT